MTYFLLTEKKNVFRAIVCIQKGGLWPNQLSNLHEETPQGVSSQASGSTQPRFMVVYLTTYDNKSDKKWELSLQRLWEPNLIEFGYLPTHSLGSLSHQIYAAANYSEGETIWTTQCLSAWRLTEPVTYMKWTSQAWKKTVHSANKYTL